MEFFAYVALFILICVVIIVICLIMQCVGSLWSSLFSGQCTQSTHIRQGSYKSYAVQPQYLNETPRKRVIAIDTESVGGPGGQSMLARVSLVTRGGKVFDTYVKPLLPVTDYRTKYSGIRERDLINAKDYSIVRWHVARLLEDSILVGHDLKHDLKSLNLTHPTEDIRDTSEYKPFRKMVESVIVEEEMKRKWMNTSHYDAFEMTFHRVQAMSMAKNMTNPKPSLKLLANKLLERVIQEGEHNSIEDAKAAMDLYLLVEIEWDVAVLYNDY